MKKKLFFTIAILMMISAFTTFALADDIVWHPANQTTLEWTPETTLSNGDPVPEGERLEYECFYVKQGADKEKDRVSVGQTAEAKMVFTFKSDGPFFLGIRTVRVRESDNKNLYLSDINWTDNPTATASGKKEGVEYYLPVDPPKGLKLPSEGVIN
jgi:hypothetical protein